MKSINVKKFYEKRDKEHWSALTTQFIYVVYDIAPMISGSRVDFIAAFPDESTAEEYCKHFNKVQKCLYAWAKVSKRDAFWKAPKGKKK